MTADLSDAKTSPEVERKSYNKRSVILVSWASVATALLLVFLIGGAVHLNTVKSNCDDDTEVDNSIKSQSVTNGTEKEDIVMSEKDKTMLYIKKDKNGAIVLITDVDYNRKISATYMTEPDQCYLAAGEHLDWSAAWNSPEPPAKVNTNNTKEDTVHWVPDMANRVTDMSLLPNAIRPFCEGKQIYWLVASEDEDTAMGRDKRHAPRGWCYCVWVYTWGYCHSTRRYQYGYIYYYYDCNRRFINAHGHCNWDPYRK